MVAALAGDSTTTRVPLPAARFFSGDAATGFFVFGAFSLIVASALASGFGFLPAAFALASGFTFLPEASALASGLTFLLAATSHHLVLIARHPAKPAI